MPKYQQRPFSIKIFVPNGDPDGLRIVEKSNWTGAGVVFNRTIYKESVGRSEFDKTGVYILVGTSEDSSLPIIYIGEGDPVKKRLNQHFSHKDFWDWAVFFVSKDNSLNKAHVKCLESRLIELASKAKQCKLDNTQISQLPSLSEAEMADVESYLIDMLSIFPLLGLNVFEKANANETPKNFLYCESKGVKATAYENAKGFIVCKGSQFYEKEVKSNELPATMFHMEAVSCFTEAAIRHLHTSDGSRPALIKASNKILRAAL
ncbi:MAG: GIY-YIG nuclease family protein, partial [Desulfobacteraceae bacterium]|nr:GIY-YIG nuclease family protein [Desulfobacteraceae bacterium]